MDELEYELWSSVISLEQMTEIVGISKLTCENVGVTVMLS